MAGRALFVNVSGRQSTLFDRDLGPGKRTRLRRLFPAGSALLLRIDQGLEEGPGALLDAPETMDLAAVIGLAEQGGFTGLIAQIGVAEHYSGQFAGRLPLILKLNGKTTIPPDDEALAPLNASTEDAVRLGADAVAYSLYAGSPAQYEDFTQFSRVRQDCARYGIPLLALAEPRGAAVERKGGPEGLYALEYAARIAAELGADMVAVAAPVHQPHRLVQAPKPYNTLQISIDEALRRVLGAAGRTVTVAAIPGQGSSEEITADARRALESGAQGLLYGRQFWQRPQAEALALAAQLRALL